MITQQIAARVLEKAMSTGGRFAELFLENTLGNNIMMVNGVLEKAVSGEMYGCGLRVFNGLNAVYAYGNDLTEPGLMKLAKAASAAVVAGQSGTIAAFAPQTVHENHKITKLPSGVNKADVTALLRQAHDAATAFHKAITQTSNKYLDVTQDVLIINSEGLWVTD